MKKLSISVLTFTLGLCAVFVWFNFEPNEFFKKINSFKISKKNRTETKRFPGISQEIAKIEIGENGYFPKKVFSNGEGAENWYSDYLKAANENSLLNIIDKEVEIYRFTWLRNFHHPIIVRIQKQSGKIKIARKEFEGRSGPQPDKIIIQKEVSINEKDWFKFKGLLNNANYWRMPAGASSGRDGAFWVLEGVKDNRYHVVHRWSPEKGEYRKACIYLLKLSGIFDSVKDELY